MYVYVCMRVWYKKSKTFLFRYLYMMTLAVDKVDGHGLSNTAMPDKGSKSMLTIEGDILTT